MYNATNAATCLWAPQRLATRLRVLRRASIQLNDLFVNLSPLRPAYRLTVALLYATQRFVCYFASPCIAPQHIILLRADQQRFSTICLLLRDCPQRLTLLLHVALGKATQRFVCQFNRTAPQRSALHRFAPRLYASRRNDLFVTTPLHAARLLTGHHGSPPLTAMQRYDLFVNLSSRSASQRDLSRRGATHLSATQRFVYYDATTTLLSAPTRTASRLCARPRVSIQLNELKLN